MQSEFKYLTVKYIYIVPHCEVYIVPHCEVYIVPHCEVYIVPHCEVYIVPHCEVSHYLSYKQWHEGCMYFAQIFTIGSHLPYWCLTVIGLAQGLGAARVTTPAQNIQAHYGIAVAQLHKLLMMSVIDTCSHIGVYIIPVLCPGVVCWCGNSHMSTLCRGMRLWLV